MSRTFSTGDGVCKDCEAGKFSGFEGAAFCANCSAESFHNSSCTVECVRQESLLLGFAELHNVLQKYSNEGGECTDCPKGKSSNIIGATEYVCTLCSPGTYSSVTGSTACTSCEPGKSTELAGSYKCYDCFAGEYSNTSGASLCTKCAAGKSSATGSLHCTNCAAGTYNDIEGGLCINCEAGKYSNTLGATSSSTCKNCEAGKSSTAGATTQIVCRKTMILLAVFV